jgi:hypothetical protein
MFEVVDVDLSDGVGPVKRSQGGALLQQSPQQIDFIDSAETG